MEDGSDGATWPTWADEDGPRAADDHERERKRRRIDDNSAQDVDAVAETQVTSDGIDPQWWPILALVRDRGVTGAAEGLGCQPQELVNGLEGLRSAVLPEVPDLELAHVATYLAAMFPGRLPGPGTAGTGDAASTNTTTSSSQHEQPAPIEFTREFIESLGLRMSSLSLSLQGLACCIAIGRSDEDLALMEGGTGPARGDQIIRRLGRELGLSDFSAAEVREVVCRMREQDVLVLPTNFAAKVEQLISKKRAGATMAGASQPQSQPAQHAVPAGRYVPPTPASPHRDVVPAWKREILATCEKTSRAVTLVALDNGYRCLAEDRRFLIRAMLGSDKPGAIETQWSGYKNGRELFFNHEWWQAAASLGIGDANLNFEETRKLVRDLVKRLCYTFPD